MATTSIWRVKGWLGKVVVYAENPDKTDNPKYFEQQNMTDSEAQGLSDVISYAVNDEKTKNEKSILDDEAVPIMERFVTGVNCLPESARNDMLKFKKRFGKEGGVVAYHGYQSFAPGESTPEGVCYKRCFNNIENMRSSRLVCGRMSGSVKGG